MDQHRKMSNLEDYFAVMRKRPGMYLGANTISRLHDHLQGYQMAYWCDEIHNPVDKAFFENFNDYVYDYYKVVTNANWKDVILEQSFGNEQVALEVFFKIFDFFKTGYSSINTKEIVLSLLDKFIFEQEEIKEKLGIHFLPILTELVDLVKNNALTNLKSDYDFIWEQLNEKCEQTPELKKILLGLNKSD